MKFRPKINPWKMLFSLYQKPKVIKLQLTQEQIAYRDKQIKRLFYQWEVGALGRREVTIQLFGLGLSYNEGLNRYNELVCQYCGKDKVPGEYCKNKDCGE